jgi:hypothetical protein
MAISDVSKIVWDGRSRGPSFWTAKRVRSRRYDYQSGEEIDAGALVICSRQFAAPAGAEFVTQGVKMRADRPRRDRELVADLRGGQTTRKQSQHLALPLGDRERLCRHTVSSGAGTRMNDRQDLIGFTSIAYPSGRCQRSFGVNVLPKTSKAGSVTRDSRRESTVACRSSCSVC